MENFRNFRDALGNFATGVCVVIIESEKGCTLGRYRAMTINSFSSVSLVPSLVLWGLKRNSQSYEYFSTADRYVFNILSHDQVGVSGRYAKYGDHIVEEGDVELVGDTPVIKGAISYFDCKRWSCVEAGDHDLLIGNVTNFDVTRDSSPLIFFKGKYRSIEALEA